MVRKLTTEIDRAAVIAFIQRLDLKKLFTVEVIEKKSTRTISQNALYWLWVSCISFETGNDKDDLHEYFKRKFITPREIRLMGDLFETYSTTNLNTLEFKHFLDGVQIFASSELGITLPNPEDNYWREFYNYYIGK